MILDTTAVIDLLRGSNQNIQQALKDTPAHSISTTSITVFEIYQGLKQKDKEKIQDFFHNICILDFDEKSAITAGEVQSQLRSEGHQIDPEDCMIAGIALNAGLPIITANKKHFGRIQKLKIESY